MNYGRIYYCDIANGIGCRTALFVSGCTHHCKGCFNEETWDFGYGQKVAMAGVPRMVAPGILARMDHNPLVPLWQDPETPLWRRVLSYVDSLLRGALKRIRAMLH